MALDPTSFRYRSGVDRLYRAVRALRISEAATEFELLVIARHLVRETDARDRNHDRRIQG